MSDLKPTPPRILVTKIGLDGHDRGSRIVASYLRDAGMEVIYTNPWQQLDSIVKLALEEDVDVIGISSLATDHLLVPKLMQSLKNAGLSHIRVIVGGIVPDQDETTLQESGVSQIFIPVPRVKKLLKQWSGLLYKRFGHARLFNLRLRK